MSEGPKPETDLGRRLGVFWCRLMHDAPMWPIHGTYQCRICAQSYTVPWAGNYVLSASPVVIRQTESGA
jgi:hypothetical protein